MIGIAMYITIKSLWEKHKNKSLIVRLEVKQAKIEHLYDCFILGEGKYPLLMFICTKS